MSYSTDKPYGRFLCMRSSALLLAGLLAVAPLPLLADPTGHTSVVRWDFNDDPTDSNGVLDNTSNGRNGTVTGGTIVHSTDTPKSSGKSLQLDGSVYIAGSAGHGDFLDSSDAFKTHNDYSTHWYVGEKSSRTVSLWVKIEDEADLTEDVVLYYHGAAPGYYFTCGVHTGQDSACRAFAIEVQREAGSPNRGWIRVGSPDGGQYVLTSSNKLSGCAEVNVADESWHHVVVVFSKELTDLEADHNVIVHIDNEKCGEGLIPQPITDVGGPDNSVSGTLSNSSRWYIAARLTSDGDRYSSGGMVNANRLHGLLDEVRVYNEVLGPAAVSWLYNNTGD